MAEELETGEALDADPTQMQERSGVEAVADSSDSEQEPTGDPEESPGPEPGEGAAEQVAGPGDDDDDDDGPDASPRLGPGADLDDEELMRRLAALLFASPEPLSLGKLVKLLERPQRPRVKAALDTLAQRFEQAGLPMQVRGLKGGYTLLSTPDAGPTLSRLARGGTVERVSAAALETLSVVAYRQPVTKAEIEAIRGVQAGPILRSLVDRGLIKVSGRADVPGHPLEYATTKEFLDRFGLLNLGELPRDAELTQD